MLFMNSKELTEQAADFLRSRLPKVMEEKAVWVHADMSSEHITETLEKLRKGEIWGIVCTDAAGMVSYADLLLNDRVIERVL